MQYESSPEFVAHTSVSHFVNNNSFIYKIQNTFIKNHDAMLCASSQFCCKMFFMNIMFMWYKYTPLKNSQGHAIVPCHVFSYINRASIDIVNRYMFSQIKIYCKIVKRILTTRLLNKRYTMVK